MDLSRMSWILICMLLCIATLAANNIFILSTKYTPYTNEEEFVETETEEPQEEIPDIEVSSVMFETAAHMSDNNFYGYTRVWEDTVNDRAVFVKDDYIPTTVVNVGDTVLFDTLTCTISSVDEQGFTIDLPGNAIAQKGWSGSPVYYYGKQVGFISKAVSVSQIYVAFL